MHIAFFNRSFYPDAAATGQLLTELCESLVKEYGHRVTVVAGVPTFPGSDGRTHAIRGLICDRESHGEIQILRARGTRFSKRSFLGRFTNYVSYFLSACLAGLRLERPEIVVALTDPPIIGLAAYIASRRFRVPLVLAYKDVFPEVARLLEDFQSELINRVLQAVNCYLIRKADHIVALGETMTRRLIEGKGADPGKVVVIPDWADCSQIIPGLKRNSFSIEHGLTDKFVIMHSGNLGLSQNLAVVLESAARLREFAGIEMVFVGDGVKKAELAARARSMALQNVRFISYQPKERCQDSFASADVFVISLKPGLAGYIVPSKLYGILAAGRPYVAMVEEECEVAAITKKYNCGLLAAPGNEEDLAQKILTLYQDRSLSRHLGDNARRAALDFDRPLQVRKYHDLFRQLTELCPKSGLNTNIIFTGEKKCQSVK